jgi:hypothetical protein
MSESLTFVVVDFWDSCAHKTNYFSVPTPLAAELMKARDSYEHKSAYHAHVLDALRASPDVTMLFPSGRYSPSAFAGGVWVLWMKAEVIDEWIKANSSATGQ